MIFKEGSPLYAVEVEREEGEDVLYVNYLHAEYIPSISNNPEVMAKVIDALIDNSH